jgi:hypothetical protein
VRNKTLRTKRCRDEPNEGPVIILPFPNCPFHLMENSLLLNSYFYLMHIFKNNPFLTKQKMVVFFRRNRGCLYIEDEKEYRCVSIYDEKNRVWRVFWMKQISTVYSKHNRSLLCIVVHFGRNGVWILDQLVDEYVWLCI